MANSNLSHEQVAELSRVLRSYCLARTDSIFDAEDLQQDILLELTRSLPTIRDEQAFYGFMWSVAKHVYRRFCQKRALRSSSLPLPESLPQMEETAWPEEEVSEDIARLRRELTLLNQRCRRAMIGHYLEGRSCAALAEELDVSESMVKYLLYKSRNKIREGMQMERTYGQQSYNPRQLDLRFWGESNHYWDTARTLISQNILFACYCNRLTAEEISLEIGVGLPYMEPELNRLTEHALLKREGKRYTTNIILFTRELQLESRQRTLSAQNRIVQRIKSCVAEKGEAVQSLGLTGAAMNHAALAWQLTCLLLHRAVIEQAWDRWAPTLPEDAFGCHALVWGEELPDTNTGFAFGVCNPNTKKGDWMRFMDVPVNGEMVHPYLSAEERLSVFAALGRGQQPVEENSRLVAAEMERRGYVCQVDDQLRVNCPVMTQSQYKELLTLLQSDIDAITDEALAMLEALAGLLTEQVPVHLKDRAKDQAYFLLFDQAISYPLASLYGEQFLLPARYASCMPTTFLVLGGE